MKAFVGSSAFLWALCCALVLACADEEPSRQDMGSGGSGGDGGVGGQVGDGGQGGGGTGGQGGPGYGGDGGGGPVDPGSCDESGLEADGTSLVIEELFAGSCEGDRPLTERHFEVLRDEDALRAALLQSVWHQHPSGEDEELPPIDFDEEVVLAAYAGELPHCGFEFRITGAYQQEDRVEVVVLLGTLCMGDDALSYPYAFVTAPKVDKPYVFTLREKDCCEDRE